MNWIKELLDLYERNEKLSGAVVSREKQAPLILLPIFHTTVAAQVTIEISAHGDFINAKTVPEDDKLTLIPVTENSASRTLRPEPHPLCDTIRYLAGDYTTYYSGEKNKNYYKDYFEPYLDKLKGWVQVSQHKKVRAIYTYLKNGSVVQDLVNSKILTLNENGQLTNEVKIEKIPQTEVMIRFRVIEEAREAELDLSDTTGRYFSECWLDQTLQQDYIQFVKSNWKEMGLSYLTGETTVITYLQPKKIRNEGDGTKLISANDSSNFTYRGRFTTKEEAFAIGFEESQKIHNALKWIIRKQGFHCGDLCIVIWDSNLYPLPGWTKDSESIYSDFGEEDEEENEDNVTEPSTNELVAKRFGHALRGYGKALNESERTVLLAMDAASPGRLSLIENKTFQTTRYIKNIAYWHESCEWLHKKFKDKKLLIYLGMPGIQDVARILYGTDPDGMLSLKGKEKVYAQLCKRLLPCITERKRIPLDLIRVAYQRASFPQSFQNVYNWEAAVALACSFIKKQRCDEFKENWSVSELKVECLKRDYLYGRLLAVADWVEYISFERDDKRETNAKRYMKAFSKRPFATWQMIEEKLQPYFKKLHPGQQNKYAGILDEIHNGFNEEDYANNTELNGLYLLGFHQQLFAFKQKTKKETENDE